MVFTSIGHMIDKELLRQCHVKMDGDKAVGMDGITKEDYEKDLEENLESLVERLKKKSYKLKPAGRVEIPKGNGKMRPLSIYCYKDKLVQEVLKEILGAVFELHFYDSMMGFRPGHSCHMALRKLIVMLEKNKTDYVLDADISGFFNHEWIMKFMGARIQDPNILRLVRRMLKTGIMEDYQFESTEEGSGQGSVCSPVIANIYMYYVLAWWFEEKVKPIMRGYCDIVIYADDFVVYFQNKTEAQAFYERLKHRMGHFGLSLEEEKSRLIEFGRFAERDRKRRGEGKPETFTFLGFTHYCSESRNDRFRAKRKTARKKFSKKCKEINRRVRDMRIWPVKNIIAKLNHIPVGYYHYYGITDNSKSLGEFQYRVEKSLYYWLNCRSQKKSYTWEEFGGLMKQFLLEKPRIYVSIYG